MITIQLKSSEILGQKLYQAFAYYSIEGHGGYLIAEGEAKPLVFGAILSVGYKISLFADKVKAVSKAINNDALKLSESWEAHQDKDGLYIEMDENASVKDET